MSKISLPTVKETWWDRFLNWFATSPFGTALRVGVGAASVWVLDNIASFNLDAVTSAVVIAGVSALLRALNPADESYGKVRK